MSNQNQAQIDALLKFRDRNKFSVISWNERGLNPSSDELSGFLNNFFNSCTNDIITAIKNNASEKQLKAILKSDLSSLNKKDYDTEEREFICSLFDELSKNIQVDFSANLNKWLYGPVLAALFYIDNIFQSNKSIATLTQPCDGCGVDLETYIIKEKPGIPETSWIVVKCKKCSTFNILSVGPNIKEFKHGNYQWIKYLRMNEFTFEQAAAQVEQMNTNRS